MTIYEFIMQSPKEIQRVFREKDWFDTYHKVPADIPSWCKCFGLEPDPRVFGYYDLSFHIREEVDWFEEFEYVVRFTVTGRNHKIVVHLRGFNSYCSSGGPEIGKNKFLPGHSKEDYHYNLAYDLPLELVADGYEGEKQWKWDDKTPTSVYVGRMMDLIKEIQPFFKTVYDSFYSGEFKKIWKKCYRRELRHGDMTNDGLFGVGLRGLVNIMLVGKRMFGVEVSLEEALHMSAKIYEDIIIGKKFNQDETWISQIMFWNRGGQRESWEGLNKETFLRLMS